MKPGQLIDAHLDLRDRSLRPGFLRWMWESVLGPTHRWPYDATIWPTKTRQAIAEAHCYRVSDDMNTLIQAAALSLDETDVWDGSLAPTPNGLVQFDNPIPMRTIQGHTNLAHWLLWRVEGAHTLYFFFNDMNIEPDEISSLRLTDPRCRPTNDVAGRWGAVTGGIRRDGNELEGTLVMPTPQRIARALAAREPIGGSTNAVRYIHSLWLMMNQKITDTAPEHVRSTTVRRAQAKGVPGRVTVVQLRRHEGERTAGESTVEWTRRWAVRAHWRWQPYGEGRQQLRRILIMPHIKGPEDKPLVISTKIYDLKR